MLQKTFCEDFLTKKIKTNQGEVPQHYVENNHEAIIDPETFEMVQRELARRTKGKNRHSGVHLLSGRNKCGDCGGWYGSKVWHSPEKCKRTVWQCNQKYKNEVRCTTPYLDEASVKERFTVAVNRWPDGMPPLPPTKWAWRRPSTPLSWRLSSRSSFQRWKCSTA